MLFTPYFNKIISHKNPEEINDAIKTEVFDVVLLDMNFEQGETSGDAGIHWLRKIKKNDPLTSVISMTAYGEISKAVRAVKAGAMDFIMKPWENDKLLPTVLTARELSQSHRKVDQLRSQRLFLNENIDKDFSDIIGDSEGIKQLINQIERIAPTEANVLIQGENGTGKEVIARSIHKNSLRNNEVLISVDMGSISESLFESELFGHEKGALLMPKKDASDALKQLQRELSFWMRSPIYL